jgi:hypothetical protein
MARSAFCVTAANVGPGPATVPADPSWKGPIAGPDENPVGTCFLAGAGSATGMSAEQDKIADGPCCARGVSP